MASASTKKSQNTRLKPFGAFFRRFHMIIFFILLAGGVASAIILINQTLSTPVTEDYTSSISAGSIDQATLERIQSLHSSDSPSPAPELPTGRINPFAE